MFSKRVLRWLTVLVVALAVPAIALASTLVNLTMPLSGFDTDPCTGEMFAFQGTEHLQISITTSSSGNVNEADTSKISMRGTGLVSGAQYVGETEDNFSSSGALPLEFTFIQTIVMIRQGETVPADDFYMFVRTHMTTNANGTPTADVSEVSPPICK